MPEITAVLGAFPVQGKLSGSSPGSRCASPSVVPRGHSAAWPLSPSAGPVLPSPLTLSSVVLLLPRRFYPHIMAGASLLLGNGCSERLA